MSEETQEATQPSSADASRELARALYQQTAGGQRPSFRLGLGILVVGVLLVSGIAVGIGVFGPRSGPLHMGAAANTKNRSTAATKSTEKTFAQAATTHKTELGAAPARSSSPGKASTEKDAGTLTATAPTTGRRAAAATASKTTAAAAKAASSAAAAKAASSAAAPSGNQILGIGSGLCVSPTGNGSGSRLALATCTGAAEEIWTIESNGTLQSQGMCMDLGSGDDDGTPVIRATCDGSKNQVFDLNSSNDLTSTGAGFLCVDAQNQGSSVGTPLQLWTCEGTGNQKWKAIGS